MNSFCNTVFVIVMQIKLVVVVVSCQSVFVFNHHCSMESGVDNLRTFFNILVQFGY